MILSKKQMNKQKKKRKIGRKILLFVFVLLLIGGGIFAYRTYKNGGGVSGMLATVVGHDENTRKNLGEFKTLILGISTDLEGTELTDTIMVGSYNPNTQKATLLSIPRDTYTGKNPSRASANDKINCLYGINHGPEATLKAVNEITGLNIEHYIVVRTEALIRIVDVIGGVTFNVPRDMNYDDPTQDLHIHLDSGEQLIDGEKAEQLLRYRHDNWDPVTKSYPTYSEEYGDNDTGRMRTQREFMTEVMKQTLKPGNIFKIGQILDVANECVDTNIGLSDAKDYIPYAVEFSTDNLVTGVLPGTNTNQNTNGVWVFIHNKKETKELIEELFFNRDIEEDISEEENQGEQNTTKQNDISKSDFKIEVINGSGENDLLQKAVKELEGSGYKVLRTGSTNSTPKTTIVDKNNTKQTILDNIKDTLGIGTISSSGETAGSSKVDITIIIGKDYK